jgi:quercetin dioxygenase-like cupin family protein
VRGAIRVEAQGIASVYLRGDCAMIAPGVPHTVTTLEPTRLVAVTIPAEPSYPPGLRGGCDE